MVDIKKIIGKEQKIGGQVSNDEFSKIETWFSKRFPDSSFEEFAKKTGLKTKK